MNQKFLRALKNLEEKHVDKKSCPEYESGYYYTHKLRYIKNYKIVKKFLKKTDKILDVGSSPCHFIYCLKELGYDIIGVDKEPKRDKKIIKENSLNIKKCDVEKENLPFKDNYFDKIIFSEIFEHLYINPIFVLKEIRRVLKKDGKLILTTPNGYSLKRVFNFILGRGLGEDPFEQFNKLFYLGHYGHVREYSLKELRNFLKKSGFKTDKVFFEYYGHYRLKRFPLINSLFNMFYRLFYSFRTHIVIISSKSKYAINKINA